MGHVESFFINAAFWPKPRERGHKVEVRRVEVV